MSKYHIEFDLFFHIYASGSSDKLYKILHFIHCINFLIDYIIKIKVCAFGKIQKMPRCRQRVICFEFMLPALKN